MVPIAFLFYDGDHAGLRMHIINFIWTVLFLKYLVDFDTGLNTGFIHDMVNSQSIRLYGNLCRSTSWNLFHQQVITIAPTLPFMQTKQNLKKNVQFECIIIYSFTYFGK